MEIHDAASTSLIPPLLEGNYIDKPEEIDRFTVQVFPNGTISFKGPRARVEEFLFECAQAGIELRVNYVSLCG